MSDLAVFQCFYELSDRLIEEATKEQLAESLRLLALDLAQYQLRYGEIMLEKTLSINVEPNDEQLELMALGMANLAGVVESVIHTA